MLVLNQLSIIIINVYKSYEMHIPITSRMQHIINNLKFIAKVNNQF